MWEQAWKQMYEGVRNGQNEKTVYSSPPIAVKLEPPDLFLASLFVGWFLCFPMFLHGLCYFSSKTLTRIFQALHRDRTASPHGSPEFQFYDLSDWVIWNSGLANWISK